MNRSPTEFCYADAMPDQLKEQLLRGGFTLTEQPSASGRVETFVETGIGLAPTAVVASLSPGIALSAMDHEDATLNDLREALSKAQLLDERKDCVNEEVYVVTIPQPGKDYFKLRPFSTDDTSSAELKAYEWLIVELGLQRN